MSGKSIPSKKILFVLFFMVVSTLVPFAAAAETYRFVTTWGTAGTSDGQFSYPNGIATDSSGNVYVMESGNNRLQMFDSGGRFLSKWDNLNLGNGEGYRTDLGPLNHPIAVAVDRQGNVYMSDLYSHQVSKYSPQRTLLKKWGSLGTGNGQFSFIQSISLDPSGNVYIVNEDDNTRLSHNVQKFTSDGVFLKKWGTYGPLNGQFMYPLDGAVDSAGNVYVADTYANRTQKFDSNGQFIRSWGSTGSGDGQFNLPIGIAVDSQGYVYVSEYGNNRIQKFTSDGVFVTKWGGEGSGDGQFRSPMKLAVDASGNVYVSDFYNSRIQKFAPVVPTTPVPALLTVTSTPSGADIFIDGVQRGTTPHIFSDIAPGIHSVTVSKIGYLAHYSTVTLSPQKSSTVDVTLQPLAEGTGIISVRSDPPGAGIVLDGASTGKTTPYDFYGITPGVHIVAVTMVEYGTYKKTITVDPGTTVVVTTPWSYNEKDTVVFVDSDPDGANVYIDDALKGATPTSLHLKKGTYIVKLTKEGYKDDESALYVISADPIQVTRTLETPGFGSILALVSLAAVVMLIRKFR